MSRVITVSTKKGPVSVTEYANFDAYTEDGQFSATRRYLFSVIERCDKPNSPEVEALVKYCNRLIACRNQRFPGEQVPYVSVVRTSARVVIETTTQTPGVAAAETQQATTVEKKITTFTDLHRAAQGMTEDEQMALLLQMSSVADNLVSMTGGRTEEEQIAFFCSAPEETKATDVPVPATGFSTTKEQIFGSMWSITRYPDGTSCVNATYICDRANPIDTVNGGIHGEAPYCFLIGLFHDNPEVMQRKGYRSPYALLADLKRAGKIIAPGKMFERDSILPVAEFLRATVFVTLLDERDERFNDGLIGEGRDFLTVRLASLKAKHYVSGTE